MARKQKKYDGPNPEVRIYQNFQDRDPSVAKGVNELFMVDIEYHGDFQKDIQENTVRPESITVHATLRSDIKRRIKGAMPTPSLMYADGRFEAGILIPFGHEFVPYKESSQMTKNIRYANKTARSIKEAVLNMLHMKDTPAPRRNRRGTNTAASTAVGGAAENATASETDN